MPDDDDVYRRMRRNALINLGSQPGQFNQQPITLAPQPGQFQQPLRQPSSRYQRQPAMLAPEVDVPPPPVPQQAPGLTDVGLGIRSGLASTLAAPAQAAESIYGGRTASGRPLSEVMQSNIGPDPLELAARQGDWNRFLQSVGGAIGAAPGYAAATALTGGAALPHQMLAAAAMGALSRSGAGASPEDAVRGAVEDAATALALHHGLGALRQGIQALPTERLAQVPGGIQDLVNQLNYAGGNPERGSISGRPVPPAAAGPPVPEAPAVLKGATPEAVLEQLAQKTRPKETYGYYARTQPGAGSELLDLENVAPAIPGRTAEVPRNVPRKPSPQAAAAMENPEVTRALVTAAESGAARMPISWYRTRPLFDRYVQAYGSEEAAIPPYERLMQMVSATSPRNKVPENIRAASYYNWLAQQGHPIPDVPATGYGNIAQQNHIANVRRILEYGALDPLKNPKPYSFSENLLGNERPLTIDTHNYRLIGMAARDPRFLATSIEQGEAKELPVELRRFKPQQAYERGELSMEEALQRPAYWKNAPSGATEYGPLERFQQELAPRLGMTPAGFQGYAWVGGGLPGADLGFTTGLKSPPETFMTTLARRVAYTADRLGVPREYIMDQFVRGKLPLMAAGGSVRDALGALQERTLARLRG